MPDIGQVFDEAVFIQGNLSLLFLIPESFQPVYAAVRFFAKSGSPVFFHLAFGALGNAADFANQRPDAGAVQNFVAKCLRTDVFFYQRHDQTIKNAAERFVVRRHVFLPTENPIGILNERNCFRLSHDLFQITVDLFVENDNLSQTEDFIKLYFLCVNIFYEEIYVAF